jgi:hypothetical protein
MWYKLKINFNSSVLSAFFILTAIGFSILLFTIWNLSIQSEKIANLKRDENYVINNITGSIVGAVELDSQGLESQSQSFMQDYLNYMFENRQLNSQFSNISHVAVSYLDQESHIHLKKTIAEWSSGIPSSSSCVERRTEYLFLPKAKYTYLIDLSVNTCTHSNLSLLEYHTLTTPVLIAFALIFLWGLCIFLMINSVQFAGSLLGSSENTVDLIEKTEQINWTNVGGLAQRALQVRGKNLQYYQTLVLDAQHDIAKILDTIQRKALDPQLSHNVTIVRNILQTLAAEVRSSDSPTHDITANREFNSEELFKLVQLYFCGSEIENNLPENFFLKVEDISIFERLMVNLASNASRHGVSFSKVTMNFEKSFFKLRIYTPISDLASLKLHFAKLTGRIDVLNPEGPVYIKFFGRTGRGLSIVKRGVVRLGGKLIFTICKKEAETGIDLPAYLLDTFAKPKISVQTRKKVIYFRNADFVQFALSLGLKDFLTTEAELNRLIQDDISLELVTDFEFDAPKNSSVRILTKKERIEGIALNWLQQGSK